MEEKKKLRCPLGVPGGILATLIGLTGIILNSVNFNLSGLLVSIALFLMGAPLARAMMMIHSANDRLDELERKMEENK